MIPNSSNNQYIYWNTSRYRLRKKKQGEIADRLFNVYLESLK